MNRMEITHGNVNRHQMLKERSAITIGHYRVQARKRIHYLTINRNVYDEDEETMCRP